MKPNETDLLLLRNYVNWVPSQYGRVVDRPQSGVATSDPMHLLSISTEQRNMIVRALDCLRDMTSS